MNSLIKVLVFVVVIGLWAATGCTQVDTGTVKAVKHFGALQEVVLTEGVHYLRPFPFASTETVVVAVGTPTSEEARAASKDLQGVHTKVTVPWTVVPEKVPCLIRGFGVGDGIWTAAIVQPAIQEVVKAVSARFSAEDLVKKRNEAKLLVEQELAAFIKHTLNGKGCAGAIQIMNVALTDFGFSPEFDAAIEAKVKAEQKALEAVNKKTERVTNAEAAAREVELAADAKAHEIEATSKAKAEAIEREAKALAANPSLVSMRIAERWNGELPHYTGGGIPMLQIKGE